MTTMTESSQLTVLNYRVKIDVGAAMRWWYPAWTRGVVLVWQMPAICSQDIVKTVWDSLRLVIHKMKELEARLTGFDVRCMLVACFSLVIVWPSHFNRDHWLIFLATDFHDVFACFTWRVSAIFWKVPAILIVIKNGSFPQVVIKMSVTANVQESVTFEVNQLSNLDACHRVTVMCSVCSVIVWSITVDFVCVLWTHNVLFLFCDNGTLYALIPPKES